MEPEVGSFSALIARMTLAHSSVDAMKTYAATERDFESGLVAIWSRGEDAVSRGHNGEHHE